MPPNIGEDFLIEMVKVDDTQTLCRLLQNQTLTPETTEAFIHMLVDRVTTLTRERKEKLQDIFSQGLYEVLKADIKTLHNWLSEQPTIGVENAEAVVKLLCESLRTVPYFKAASETDMVAAFDNNLENLLLLDEKPSCMDILLPMRIWRVADEYAVISRTIVDIEVLAGKGLSDVARQAYVSYGRMPDPLVQMTHETRAGAIQWAGRAYNNKPEMAKKYEVYTKEKMAALRKGLDLLNA